MAIVVGTKKEKAPRESVTFGFMRDDEYEEIALQAVLSLDAAGMRRTLLAARKESSEVLEALFASVAKSLDNTDGVPSGWAPKPMYKTIGGASTSDPELAAPDSEPGFRVPHGEHKGEIWPLTKAAEFLNVEQVGSSRARWNYLIVEDESAVVDAKDVTELFEKITAATANRPTVASS